MVKSRLEAFSDGVIAIIITIMVLELKVPHGESLDALAPLIPVFLSYVLSFVYVGIYWNNHHHMLHAVRNVTGAILWANLHLLFWLSLFPFATGWMGENHFAAAPSALYGFVLLMAAIAYWVLQQLIICSAGAGFAAQKSRRQRLERQGVAVFLSRGDRGGVLVAVDFTVPVRAGCVAVAGARPAHRTRADRRGKLIAQLRQRAHQQ
jgi:uncharacterized membrane protein